MDAVGSERAVLLGLSEGGPMAMLFAATYPERTIALIAYGETPRYAWAPDFPRGDTDEELERSIADDRARWGTNRWADDELRGVASASSQPVNTSWKACPIDGACIASSTTDGFAIRVTAPYAGSATDPRRPPSVSSRRLAIFGLAPSSSCLK